MVSLSSTHGQQGNQSISYDINREGYDKELKGAYHEFCEGCNFWKKYLWDALSFQDGYGKEGFTNTYI